MGLRSGVEVSSVGVKVMCPCAGHTSSSDPSLAHCLHGPNFVHNSMFVPFSSNLGNFCCCVLPTLLKQFVEGPHMGVVVRRLHTFNYIVYKGLLYDCCTSRAQFLHPGTLAQLVTPRSRVQSP